jgi:hypothetical protein
MTHKIMKSALAPPPITYDEAVSAFGRLVATYIGELQTWHDHDQIVQSLAPQRPKPVWADYAAEKDPGAAFLIDNAAYQAEKLARHEPYPKPIGHPDIIASVATKVGDDGSVTYVPHFEIVDDDPTPDEILAAKKIDLLSKISAAEQEAIDRAELPLGKRRAAALLEADISAEDAKVATDLIDKTPEANRAQLDIAKELKKRRDPKHTQHLQDQESRRAKIEAIVRAGAQAMSDIEDLTADKIDTFEIPSFGPPVATYS